LPLVASAPEQPARRNTRVSLRRKEAEMTAIEKYPRFIPVVMNIAVTFWWALLAPGHFPPRLHLLALLLSLVPMNVLLLIVKYRVKRTKKRP
jgi:hypothetical protein